MAKFFNGYLKAAAFGTAAGILVSGMYAGLFPTPKAELANAAQPQRTVPSTVAAEKTAAPTLEDYAVRLKVHPPQPTAAIPGNIPIIITAIPEAEEKPGVDQITGGGGEAPAPAAETPPVPEPAPKIAPEPVPDAPPIAAPASSGKRMASVDARSEDGAVVIDITTGAPASYRSFTVRNPARLVIDLPGKFAHRGDARFPLGTPLVSAVRVGRHPDKFRVVVDLADAASADPVFKKTGQGLTVVFPAR